MTPEIKAAILEQVAIGTYRGLVTELLEIIEMQEYFIRKMPQTVDGMAYRDRARSETTVRLNKLAGKT